MNGLKGEEIREAVRVTYAKIAQSEMSHCGCNSTSCCDAGIDTNLSDYSIALGYSSEEVSSVPEGANMGLGCGNPQAMASLKEGETVLDLGSGGGFDCFLASRQVGDSGYVIGVDMTPEMIHKARLNAAKGGFKNVEFRLGEIENLPVADKSVDMIISNCAINLALDKKSVFKEAFRVLKSGGRLAISDIVAFAPIPDEIKRDIALYTGCMAGASLIEDLETMIRNAGFVGIKAKPKDESKTFIREWTPGDHIHDYVVSATIEATKP